jgi:His-Xaa-Ser system protein HxsD
MELQNKIHNGTIELVIDGKLFSKDTVLKTMYWFGDKFLIDIATKEDNFLVSLKPLSSLNLSNDDLEHYLQKAQRDLIDFSLRETINKETTNIRELLIAKAFSNGEYDEAPPGEITDPVGFEIQTN